MRKSLSVLLAIAAIFAVVSMASAEIIQTTIESMTVSVDKNGKEYVRLIVPITKEEGGMKYDLTVPAMAFGDDLVKFAKTLKAGDKVKFAYSKRYYQGRMSLTIHKFGK